LASYLRPRELDEALRALSAAPRVILAGGTDHFPARVGRPGDEEILDISAIGALRRIEETAEGWRIPALCTWSDVIAARLPPAFDGLKAAAREVGGVQIQNAGTVCGNVCNASPAADGVPNLMALDAEVELASLGGTRRLKIAEFVLGNRRTARRADELVVALHVPRPRDDARGAFLKLGTRRYLVISIVMAAGVVAWRDGRIAQARLAIGACGPVARRLPKLEQRLPGVEARRIGDLEIVDCDFDALAPIDDVRATAEYRRDACMTLTRRLLAELRP